MRPVRQQSDEPQGYYCVPAIRRLDGKQHPLDRLDRNLLSGSLSATLITEQPLLVGSGEAEVTNGGQVLCFARIHKKGKLVIPGSSLKGAIRTYAEALSPSCRAVTDNCKKCPACTIFGSTDHQGRFGFEDAEFEAKTESKSIDQRRKPTVECPGRKFYYFDLPEPIGGEQELVEVVPKDTRIACRARFANLADWELGLVLLAMGTGKDGLGFSLKICGAKNRKMGKVRFDRATVAIVLDRDLAARVAGTDGTRPAEADELIEEYVNSCGRVKDAVLANIALLRKGSP